MSFLGDITAPPPLTHDDVTKHVRQAVLPEAGLDVLPQTWTVDLLAPVPQGFVSLVNQMPAFNNTLTPYTWDSLDFAAAGCQLLPSGIVVPVDGAYTVCVNTQWDFNATGQRQTLLYANNDYSRIRAINMRNALGGRTTTNIAMDVRLSAGDKVTPNTYQDSGGTVNLLAGGETRMSVVFKSN